MVKWDKRERKSLSAELRAIEEEVKVPSESGLLFQDSSMRTVRSTLSGNERVRGNQEVNERVGDEQVVGVE